MSAIATPMKLDTTVQSPVEFVIENPDRSTPISFFPSMPVSLSRIIHHTHSFTRLEIIYHHIYFIYHTFDIEILAVCRIFVP